MDRYANLKYEQFFQRQTRIIFHVDIDSFFVSCERLLKPWLVSRPVVISRLKHRGVITSVSYEARCKAAKFKIETGMQVSELRKRVKGLYIIEANIDFYEQKSQEFFSFLNKHFSRYIEKFSIDEAFIDVTNLWQEFGHPKLMAIHLQNQIRKHLKLPSSIGISYTKFGAKMATNLAKPFGILMVLPPDFAKTFFPLPLINFFGLGPKSVEKLKTIGVVTIGDLAKRPYGDPAIIRILGKKAISTLDNAKGIGEDTVVPFGESNREIGQVFTFLEGATSSRSYVLSQLAHLIQNVVSRAKNEQMIASTIVVMARFPNLNSWFTKQQKFRNPSLEFKVLFQRCEKLLELLWTSGSIYGVGFKLKDLKSKSETNTQRSLFETLS